MNVFVTGATGYIGTAVVAALHDHGHTTVALVRSEASVARAEALGSVPLRGDMSEPGPWLPALPTIDGIVHAADTFDAGMQAAESAFLDGLLAWIADRPCTPAAALPMVYTGGLWLYGENGDRTAVEGTPFSPPPAYTHSIRHRDRLVAAAGVSVRVLHPAMVWDERGGVFERFMAQAAAGRPPEITGNAQARWPLIHRGDLARLYVRVLERGTAGSDYHGVAETGVPVAEIAAAIATRANAPAPVTRPVAEVMRELGSWAACLAWDQTMDAPLTRSRLDWTPRHAGALETLTGAEVTR